MGLEDDARVDFSRLRRERRAKVLVGMERHGLDALMLGGVGNVRYVSGARQLGRAGVLPFAPVVVVVRETGRVHLLSTWDEGVPPEIGRDDLYGLSWNPVNLATSLASIDGLRQAQRVGTDGLTPMFAGLLPQLVTTAELVDAAPVLAAARRIKTPDEITCLDVASALAEAALSALDDALEPGITERELLGVYYERVASLGSPMAPSESVCFATPTQGPVRSRHLATDRSVGDGELVVLAPSALYAGYEAGLARTRVAGSAVLQGATDLATRCARGMDALVAACRPGNTGADLYRVGERREPRITGPAGAWDRTRCRATGDRVGSRTRCHARGGHGAQRPVLGHRRRRRRLPGTGHGAGRQCRAVDTYPLRKAVMTSHRTVFNHVGLCVTDRARSRRFYEGLLGFQFWWELEPPDEGTDQLLQLENPGGLHATYLVRDGLVLELLDYSKREVHAGPRRVMDELGLTHLSLSVSGLSDVLALVDGFGGSVVDGTVSEQSAMIRDPDGQLIELLADSWLAVLPPRP
jgi:Xaa-Pro aminopeptidase/catechol 2,3-dioxygenase-like lactoylglutathione lyase family enzyme